jgi:hypothetical protein
VALPARRETDVGEVRESAPKGAERGRADTGVHMDHHWRPLSGEVPRDLRRAVERVVDEHDEAHRHAQFPADMSPRRSSCRHPS